MPWGVRGSSLVGGVQRKEGVSNFKKPRAMYKNKVRDQSSGEPLAPRANSQVEIMGPGGSEGSAPSVWVDQ